MTTGGPLPEGLLLWPFTAAIFQTSMNHTETHYKPKDLARIWNLSTDAIRKIFADVPGVFRIGKKRRGVRKYDTLRIPASVAERVYRDRCKV